MKYPRINLAIKIKILQLKIFRHWWKKLKMILEDLRLSSLLNLQNILKINVISILLTTVYRLHTLSMKVPMIIFNRKKKAQGSKEMFQRPRVLTALVKDPGSVPRNHIMAQNCNLNSRRSSGLFWPTKEPGMRMVHIHI